jgi:hypothetical protein
MRRDGRKRKPSRAKLSRAQRKEQSRRLWLSYGGWTGTEARDAWQAWLGNELLIDRLLRVQEGCCAICRKPFGDPAIRWPVRGYVRDHDHQTGLLRGFLCNRCNFTENDSPAWVAYRVGPPVAKLGIGPVPYRGMLSPEAIRGLRRLPDWSRKHISRVIADADARPDKHPSARRVYVAVAEDLDFCEPTSAGQ